MIRLLLVFLATGLVFMVLPGTFLGVWNLFAISAHHAPGSISAAWIQAHGHAQLFGWVGSFILGIGFYSIPNIRRICSYSYWELWLCWAMWTAGVGARWAAEVYGWHWRILLPISAAWECGAVALFLVQSVRGYSLQVKSSRRAEVWMVSVVAGAAGLALAMALNLYGTVAASAGAATPVFPPDFDGRFLVVAIWGFFVPTAWGFTAHWMPVFLGLGKPRGRLLLAALCLNSIGVALAVAGLILPASVVVWIGALCAFFALRFLEKNERPAKTTGVHPSFPLFVRLAYLWLLVAGALLIWAAMRQDAAGLGGAGRHALTVGFIAGMIFSVAPRILPAFLGRKKLYSQLLMLISLLLLTCGCSIRVVSEMVAYQYNVAAAWTLLPVSASLELAAVVAFAVNVAGTFLQPPLMSACELKK